MSPPLPTLVVQLGLSNTTVTKLKRHDIETTEALSGLNRRELASLAGIGSATMGEILGALAAHGLALAIDPYAAYVCARHNEPRGDALLTSFWLCEECTGRFITEALHDSAPEYVGERVEGFCSHCNRQTAIGLRQWLLCPVCERVLRSIGRSLVAGRRQVNAADLRRLRYPTRAVLMALGANVPPQQTEVASVPT